MSIRDEINHRCGEGRLFSLEPALPGIKLARTIFVSEDVNNALRRNDDIRFGMLRGQLDTLIGGGLISVAEDPYDKDKTAYIARLDPISDEAWQIRSIDPKPAIRVFGHFAETNVFVALTWRYRKELGGFGSKEWKDEINRCKAKWRILFHPYKPHRGTDVSDYISSKYHLV